MKANIISYESETIAGMNILKSILNKMDLEISGNKIGGTPSSDCPLGAIFDGQKIIIKPQEGYEISKIASNAKDNIVTEINWEKEETVLSNMGGVVLLIEKNA